MINGTDNNYTETFPAEFVDTETLWVWTGDAPQGLYEIRVTLNRQCWTQTSLNYTFIQQPENEDRWPTKVLSTGGSVVHVTGRYYPIEVTDDVYCVLSFNGTWYYHFLGEFISSTNVSCVIPDLSDYLLRPEITADVAWITLTFNNQSVAWYEQQLHIVTPHIINYTSNLYQKCIIQQLCISLVIT